MIVVDTNIISYLFLPSKYTLMVEKVLKTDEQWAVPLLWRSEFCNVLFFYLRRKIISITEALNIMNKAEALVKNNEFSVSSEQVLSLIEQCQCSAYDCEFVVLAKSLSVPIVTVDKQIIREFPQIAVGLEKFINKF